MMQRYSAKVAAALAACAVMAVASGCASPGQGAFPRLGANSTSLNQKVLSGEEKNAAIRDLSFQQSTHRDSAKRQIEGQ